MLGAESPFDASLLLLFEHRNIILEIISRQQERKFKSVQDNFISFAKPASNKESKSCSSIGGELVELEARGQVVGLEAKFKDSIPSLRAEGWTTQSTHLFAKQWKTDNVSFCPPLRCCAFHKQ